MGNLVICGPASCRPGSALPVMPDSRGITVTEGPLLPQPGMWSMGTQNGLSHNTRSFLPTYHVYLQVSLSCILQSTHCFFSYVDLRQGNGSRNPYTCVML